MKEPEDVLAMLALQKRGWGSKRIARWCRQIKELGFLMRFLSANIRFLKGILNQVDRENLMLAEEKITKSRFFEFDDTT